MTFSTADEANRFLVEEILREGERGGERFSTVDEHELRTPGCGHTQDEDEALDAALPPGYDDWALRVRAARLLRRAYRARGQDGVTQDKFREAYARLRKSPYLLTNLTHADAPILETAERLRLQPVLQWLSVAFGAMVAPSLTPPVAALRPSIAALIAVSAVLVLVGVTVAVLVR